MRLPSFKFSLPRHGDNGGDGGHLRCPYKGCEQTFDKPSLLTDMSVIPSESYYACPHCMSKIDIITDKLKVVDVRAVGYGAAVFESPAKCAHYNGGLQGSTNFNPQGNGTDSATGIEASKNYGCTALLDECLVCPKILQCEQRKHKY